MVNQLTSNYTVVQETSLNPLKDILIPAKERIKFHGGDFLTIPVHFIHVRGVKGLDKESFLQYEQQLHDLATYMQTRNILHHIQEGYLTLPLPKEVDSFTFSSHSERNSLQEQCMRIFNASMLVSHVKSAIFERAFLETMNQYGHNQNNVSSSKVENVGMKLLTWLQRNIRLFEQMPTDIPKWIQFGELKEHEAYFLLLLSRSGVDVLHVQSDLNMKNSWQTIDLANFKASLFEEMGSLSLSSYPKTSPKIQMATVAQKASKEIDQLLYQDDAGVFKHQQFQERKTRVVSLKTTYDELKILWDEEAKIRSYFEVNAVYVTIPNIFAKVSGAHHELGEYWKDVRFFLSTSHTAFFEHVSFANRSYGRHELYKLTYLLDDNGNFSLNEMKKDDDYPFHHLKEETQRQIVDKLNELISTPFIVGEMDIHRKILLLMEVWRMDKKLSRLLNVFDYAGQVPKIVVYDKDESMFGIEEALILSFFHFMGFDILILTPTQYQNIEQWIEREQVDVHLLPNAVFEQELPKRLLEKQEEPTSFWTKWRRK